ncbi:hypothetical protein FFLO_05533 [Filobasidium floriforme]|uniref:NADP-dependent oxidoreductase domain-containing protein n=1 Tax=Filobasidium floriforme TaxID=5210 RepID=A0A8K0JIW5_9TREE|nr:hypothetical protein FFLO_05533 [Filobasidium floriforme]
MSTTVPRIIYGTAWKKEATTDLVVKAVLNGFRAIDTACQPKHYREDLVGQAISELETSHGIPRSSLYVQTKFTPIDGQDLTQPLPYEPRASTEDKVDQSIATSLKQLGVEYIDCLVMHSPMRDKKQTLKAYRQLEQHHARGTVRSLGISNIYSASTLRWLIEESKVKLSVVQNRWHKGNRWDWEVFNVCRENGIMYQSFWTLSGNPSLLAHPLMRQLAEKYGITREQALFKLCSQIGITPLSGTTSEEHMKQDVEAIAMKDFEADEVEAVVNLIQ